jgi:xyloglucan-specific endo-beta-1,4-glucanase
MKVYSFLPVHGPIFQFSADVKYFFDYLTHEHQFPAQNQHMLSMYNSLGEGGVG